VNNQPLIFDLSKRLAPPFIFPLFPLDESVYLTLEALPQQFLGAFGTGDVEKFFSITLLSGNGPGV
jgi:hypothetical protein